MEKVICPYCEKPAPLVTGKEVYPHRRDLWRKRFYRCHDCDAHVGVHPGTERPLGTPAGPALRKVRMKAHAAFDPLWKYTGAFPNRSAAYRWLARQLGIKAKRCHIGHFDGRQCNKTITFCAELQGSSTEKEPTNDRQNT